MNPLLSELTALPPSPSRPKPESPSLPKPRKQLSDASIARFRQAMQGKGWFLRRDLEPLLGLTRPQLNHAFTKHLIPLGYVEQEWVSKLARRYRWKSGA